MKNLVKRFVRFISEHKVAVAVSLILGIAAGILLKDYVTALVVTGLIAILAVFFNAWEGVKDEDLRFVFRWFILFGVLFISGSLISCVGMVFEAYGMAEITEVIDHVARYVGLAGCGLAALLMVYGIFAGLYCGWKAAVRWAQK